MKKNPKIIAISCLLAFFIGKFLYNSFIDYKNRDILELYGNIDIRDVNLGFRVSGRLEKLNFDEGDFVKNGDILAQLDPEPYISDLQIAKHNYENCLAAFNSKKNNFERIQKLFNEQIKSKQEYEDALNSFKQQKAILNDAYERIKLAKIKLDDCTLKSPSDGIIISRIFEKGSILNSGINVYSVLLYDNVYAKGYVEEIYLGKLKIGDKVEIHTDSGTFFEGKVSYISPVSEFTPKTIETKKLRTDLVYRIHFSIEKHEKKLHKGMPVTIKIKLKDSGNK